MRLRSGIGPAPVLSAPSPPTLIDPLAEFLTSRGAEAYLVGGVVRDALLGREITDIDLAVAADVHVVGRELASFLGGTFVVMDRSRDITRVVVTGVDGSSVVDLSSIHDGIAHDLRQRDFTVDAMALPLVDARAKRSWDQIVDPHDGLSDLRQGIIRAVSPSAFQADPARLVRAPRLATQLRFEVAEETRRQIRKDAHLVATVAPERIRDELLKLMAEQHATASLRLLDDLDLLCRIIPELGHAKGVSQPREHHFDVFDHSVETASEVERVVLQHTPADGFVEEMVPRHEQIGDHFGEEVTDGHTRLTMLKLAGLLHDIAKPATRTVESSGRIRFLGHHSEGAEVAQRILKRLRISGRGVELARLLVQNHLRPGQMAQQGELPTGKAVFRYFRDLGDAAIDTLYLNMADYLAARGPKLSRREWSKYCLIIGHILREGLERKAPQSLPKLIDGFDIMNTFRLSPGPEVGRLLGLVIEGEAEGDITTRDEALTLVKSNLDTGGVCA